LKPSSRPGRRRPPNRKKADDYRAEAFDLYFTEEVPADEAKLREALIKAKRSVLLDPGYENLTMIASILGEYDDAESNRRAVEYCDRAITLEPGNPDAYASKASLLSRIPGRLPEAEQAARTSIALSLVQNDSIDTIELEFSSLVDILIDQRKYTTARAAIRLALRHSQSEFLRSLLKQASQRIKQETRPSERA